MKFLFAVLAVSLFTASCNNSSTVSGRSARERDSIRVIDSLDSVEKQMKKEEAETSKTSTDTSYNKKDTTGK